MRGLAEKEVSELQRVEVESSQHQAQDRVSVTLQRHSLSSAYLKDW